ncbi:hypothetical protein B296_00019147 [Ensete ventricosum]|uniref:40S ribosomal protein S19 n=1 Tax=Ensete ventricosum TaxID=4639 RepID=A0A426ZFJ0_ENSVE|nr:hypothetical protein B296_00019147 [Ensete ventricosum]
MREREGVILHLFRVGRWRSVGFPIEITTHDINSRKNESNSAHLLQCESLPRQKNRALSLPVGSLRRSQLWLPRVAVALSCSSARRQTSTMENAVARTVKDVSPHEFVKSYSAHLKRSGKIMEKDVKASMARKIYLRQGIGVGGFQKIYGGRKRNGSCPPHFCKSSGAIARHILRQLERMNIIEIDFKG